MPNITLYISQPNIDNLRSTGNMSRLVDDLLTEHFSGDKLVDPAGNWDKEPTVPAEKINRATVNTCNKGHRFFGTKCLQAGCL